jgi:hypothetical protein
MLISEKITLIITAWILIVLIITSEINLEIFFILILIGVLVIREIINLFISTDLKDRMNVFIYFFLIIFIVIVGKKVINII